MTASVAVASLAAKYGMAGDVLCLLAVPVLVAAAVGVLAGSVKRGIGYGLIPEKSME